MRRIRPGMCVEIINSTLLPEHYRTTLAVNLQPEFDRECREQC